MEQSVKGKIIHTQQQLMYAITLKSPDKTDVTQQSQLVMEPAQ